MTFIISRRDSRNGAELTNILKFGNDQIDELADKIRKFAAGSKDELPKMAASVPDMANRRAALASFRTKGYHMADICDFPRRAKNVGG